MIHPKSEQQLALFQTPFEQNLDSKNRWVQLAHRIPWDALAPYYYRQMDNKQGTPAKDARLILGAVIIKHKENLTDEDTIEMIKENVYMQYFLGLSSFKTEKIFEPSLFVAIRKRLIPQFWKKLNEILIAHVQQGQGESEEKENIKHHSPAANADKENKGDLLLDATVAPQDIAYPNDLDLVNQSRMKADELITLISLETGQYKPRTYNRVARKQYLSTAKKKKRSRKEIRKAIGKQLRYLKRNLSYLDNMLQNLSPQQIQKIVKPKHVQYYYTLTEVYQQQKQMYDTKTHTVANRIVSIHQPHVRPMVRGKSGAGIEFGSKLDVSLHNGFARLEHLEWNNYHEAQSLALAAENYKTQYGYYPAKIIVDRKYCTRENRTWCKERGIHLSGKPLGRPTERTKEQLQQLKEDSGKRNAIEGKFGQGKRAYGLDCIKAKLQRTSESWIGAIVFVLNLVKWEQIFWPFYFFISFWKKPLSKHNMLKILTPTF